MKRNKGEKEIKQDREGKQKKKQKVEKDGKYISKENGKNKVTGNREKSKNSQVT